jgi:hypothetical protein
LPKGIRHNKYKEYGYVWIDGRDFEDFKTAQVNLYRTTVSGDYVKDCNFLPGHTDGTWGWTSTNNFFVQQRGNTKTNFNLRSIGVQGATLFWKALKK